MSDSKEKVKDEEIEVEEVATTKTLDHPKKPTKDE